MLNVWENQADNKQDLTPVVCILFYHGKRRWTHQETVKNIPEELKHFVPLFDYVLFDTKDVEDHAIISHFKRSNVRIGVWFLKHSDNLIGFIRDNPALAREMFRELSNIEKENIQRIAVYLYTVSGMAPEKIDQIMETTSPEAIDAFDEFRIKLIEQGREEGREEGIEQSLNKIALNMILKGYADEQIAEITNLSIRRIQALRKECSV